ncbi:two-component regulator propeller domain-containing protein [Flavimarina sp. Hel_I_48]|uniref:type IX secretion system anionic LPS delivery protein PorZ n=1 Tax=Flavimarina sp. Hel_I_48 TaxID=1392488 RepID=UPI0004DF994A|nr:two-component regulator propeller domain-containing protein [Flavimarina sp. Hel_I_48]
MIKKLLLAFVFLTVLSASAQDYSDSWKGYFSYTSINDITYGNGRVYAAAQNSVFSYDATTDELSTLSTIEGLSGETISAIYYSDQASALFVGYASGLFDVVQDNGDVLTVVDIVNKNSIPPNEKQINHFLENNGLLYISTDFGISLYNIERLEFDDSYFIGAAGGRLHVRQTAISGSFIYAATQEGGLRRASVQDENLIDFQNWSPISNGNWLGIVSSADRLYAVDANNTLNVLNGTTFTTLSQYPSRPLRLTSGGTGFTVTLTNRVYAYDSTGRETASIALNEQYPGSYSTAFSTQGLLFIGSSESGLLMTSLSAAQDLMQVLPDGPLRNDPFSIEAIPGELWVVYGDYSNSFNPYPLKRRGFSHLRQESGWENSSYQDARNANNMVNITINPENTEEVFLSSFNSGLLEINEGIATQLFDETNSGLSDLPVNPTDVRINGAAFDSNGNLWMTNTLVENALARKSGNDITGFSIKEIVPNFDEVFYTQLVTDRQGNVYFGSDKAGLIAYNPVNENFAKLTGEEEANLPSDDIRALALDNSGTLWIGTTAGLRLLFGPAQVFENPEVQTSTIVILENDIPVELLNEQSIQSIAVDGSNNKWVGTLSNGVFYFSSNGQETLLQFNTSNSPLPSNTISAISIDDESGEVFFATPQGLVSYAGSAVAAADNLEAVRAFPNPVKPQFTGQVTIDGLTERANVKITDITGNLVYEEVSEGGSIQWDTTAFGKHKVATGVYLVLVTSSDASETKIAKIMIIR